MGMLALLETDANFPFRADHGQPGSYSLLHLISANKLHCDQFDGGIADCVPAVIWNGRRRRELSSGHPLGQNPLEYLQCLRAYESSPDPICPSRAQP
jgi:hypothetical protein